MRLFFAAERLRLIAITINWRLSHQRFYALVLIQVRQTEVDFLPTLLSNLSPILLLLYCLQFVKKMKACELEIVFIESARPRDVEQMERSQSFHHTLHAQLILFAERR